MNAIISGRSRFALVEDSLSLVLIRAERLDEQATCMPEEAATLLRGACDLEDHLDITIEEVKRRLYIASAFTAPSTLFYSWLIRVSAWRCAA